MTHKNGYEDIAPVPQPRVPALGEPAFFILLSLADGPRHGYAVLKDVEEMSGGRVALSVSTLYTTLGRLLEQGLIERGDDGNEELSPGLPRKVYRLTSRGQGALGREANRLRLLLSAYRSRLGEEPG
jgi:DNA-binding PadR family transcriptional regulator